MKTLLSKNLGFCFGVKEAIKKGISMLENEDILLILGKGHEDTHNVRRDFRSREDG